MKDENKWWQSIRKLQGEDIYTLSKNKKNTILKVEQDVLFRISSNNIKSKISRIEIETIIKQIVKQKTITRKEVFCFNNNRRNSSVIFALISKIDNFFYNKSTETINYIKGFK